MIKKGKDTNNNANPKIPNPLTLPYHPNPLTLHCNSEPAKEPAAADSPHVGGEGLRVAPRRRPALRPGLRPPSGTRAGGPDPSVWCVRPVYLHDQDLSRSRLETSLRRSVLCFTRSQRSKNSTKVKFCFSLLFSYCKISKNKLALAVRIKHQITSHHITSHHITSHHIELQK